MGFSSKLTLMVQGQADKGGRVVLQFRGVWLQDVCTGSMERGSHGWPLVGTCAVPFSCTELLFLNRKGMWGWAGIFALQVPLHLGRDVAGKGQCLWKSALGTHRLHFKILQWLLEAKSASVQWLSTALSQWGNLLLVEGPGGQRATSCFYGWCSKYISSYCKADKILRGFLYLQAQLSRLNIT